jgi:hypothetical protein
MLFNIIIFKNSIKLFVSQHCHLFSKANIVYQMVCMNNLQLYGCCISNFFYLQLNLMKKDIYKRENVIKYLNFKKIGIYC